MYTSKAPKRIDCIQTIGERIAQLRKQHNLTQQKLSDDIGYSRGQISKWEKSLAEPSPAHIIALADYFDVSCDYILRGYDQADLPLGQKLNLSQEALDGLADLTNVNEAGGKAFSYFIENLHNFYDLSLLLQEAVQLTADITHYEDEDCENGNSASIRLPSGILLEKERIVRGILHDISSGFYAALYDGVQLESKAYQRKENIP